MVWQAGDYLHKETLSIELHVDTLSPLMYKVWSCILLNRNHTCSNVEEPLELCS